MFNPHLSEAHAANGEKTTKLFDVIAAVSCLLSAVTLDLSQYAMDIGKALASKASAGALYFLSNMILNHTLSLCDAML